MFVVVYYILYKLELHFLFVNHFILSASELKISHPPNSSPTARRNTLGHFPDKDKRPFTLQGRSYDDNTEPAQRPKYPETKADIERALKGSSGNISSLDKL